MEPSSLKTGKKSESNSSVLPERNKNFETPMCSNPGLPVGHGHEPDSLTHESYTCTVPITELS